MNQYPAVDIVDSISRLMKEVSTPEEISLAGTVSELVATYREAEDLINIGAYVKGSNEKIDRAIEKHDALNEFFSQGISELCSHEDAVSQLAEVVESQEDKP